MLYQHGHPTRACSRPPTARAIAAISPFANRALAAANAPLVGPCARSTLVAPQRRPPILFFTRYDTMIRDSSH